MNYRHAFHAGNFADVLKHATLVRILVHLARKPSAFRVLDTHAGAGFYDLTGAEASRGGEWREGIARLLAGPVAGPAAALLAPYIEIVKAHNRNGALALYPGSPVLIRAFLRPQDRLIACEIEPGAAAALARELGRDRRAKALAIDGWTALNAYVPPKERRGLVLIDPSYEDADELARLAQALPAAYRKWPTGIYLAWYPVKERAAADALAQRLRRAGIDKLLHAELDIGARPRIARSRPATQPGPHRRAALTACGLLVINPPWTLADELALLLPALAAILSDARGAAHRLDVVAGEK
jgi:23S rRNA (adenine2030-N6)-methyltransferase